jgi:tetratricopeptide (TPR) repeat protein
LPDVALTLNNLGSLRKAKNQFPEAEAALEEALAIRRTLAEANPQTYLPDLAMTAVNMSIFYLQAVPDREKSLAYAREALLAALPFVEDVPSVQDDVRMTMQVVLSWGPDTEGFWEETLRAALGGEEG